MSKTALFRGPFDKQHGKRAQALLKSTLQHLDDIHLSLPRKLSWKKSLLLTGHILGLLVNTLASNEKYPGLNRDNLMILIKMQLSQKQRNFPIILLHVWNLDVILSILPKKRWQMTLIDFVIWKLWTRKTSSDKRLKSSVSENRSRRNIVNPPKHC